MPRPQKKDKPVKSAGSKIIKRFVIISFFIFLFGFAIIYNLVQTTVVHASDFRNKANAELSKREAIIPERGEILAADGSVLATNLIYYTARIDFRAPNFDEEEFRKKLQNLSDTLAMFYPKRTSKGWKEYLGKELAKPKEERSQCFPIINNLSYDEGHAFKDFPFFNLHKKNPNYTGLVIDPEHRRSYPYGTMARRSIGRVERDTIKKEIHGTNGLEKALDHLLFGKVGYYKKVPLTKGIVNWSDIAAVNGSSVKTTIDIGIQDIVEHELASILQKSDAEWGTVVLMEVNSGDIKAISSLARTSKGEYVEKMDYAIQRYEPGSVIKTVSMVVALEEGFTKNPDNEFYTIESSYQFGAPPKFRDTHSPSSLPVSRFLEYSSNIGMTKLVASHYKDNPDGFRQRVAELGFFDKYQTGISGELPPKFPTLEKNLEGITNLGRQTFGYGTLVSPLYICGFYNAIANDGKFVRPRLVSEIHSAEGDSIIKISYIRERMCSPATAAQVKEMLHKVIRGEHGTAKWLRDDLVDIAGKTGTSRIAVEYTKEQRELAKINPNDPSLPKLGYIQGAYRYSFCGFFPFKEPRYTCMVMVSRPQGEYASAPMSSGQIVLNIAKRLYSRGLLGTPPSYKDNVTAGDDIDPVMYATTNSQRDRSLKSMLASPEAKRIKTPVKHPTGTVPSVRGLGLREAIVVLEKAGYNIKFRGDGSVVSQVPEAGTRLPKGSKIDLVLTKN